VQTWLARLTSPVPASDAPAKVAADGFIDSYVRWREASEHLSLAYTRWAKCEPSQRRLEFNGYLLALDREEFAASMHSYWTERLHALER
jgi:hypothetical protein